MPDQQASEDGESEDINSHRQKSNPVGQEVSWCKQPWQTCC